MTPPKTPNSIRTVVIPQQAVDSLDVYTHVTTQMQQTAADKMANFMESAMPSAPAPEPPDPPQESGCKVIPFERVG